MSADLEKLEDEFDNFFSLIGYQRVNEIVGDSPDFQNADYINRRKEILVELKTIDKDFFAEGGMIDRLQMFVSVPKKIDSDGQGIYEMRLPEINREGKADSFEEPLRRILKKANRQLRQTNEKLLNNNGYGFVMLVVNWQTSINLFMIRKLVAELLCEEFSSISAVLLCTPNWGLVNYKTKEIFPACLHCSDSRLNQQIIDELISIAVEWGNFYDSGGHGEVEPPPIK